MKQDTIVSIMSPTTIRLTNILAGYKTTTVEEIMTVVYDA